MLEYIKKYYLWLFLVVIIVLVGLMTRDVIILSKNNIFADEYIFLKVSSNLPDYNSSVKWLYEHSEFDYLNPENTKDIQAAYNHTPWIHPWIPSLIMYPVTKIFNNFIEQIWIYRAIYMMIVFITIVILSDVIRRKYGWLIASVSLIPLLIAQNLLLAGAYVYGDAWMWLFLALSLWLQNKGSKWKYLTLVLMVLCKIYACVLIVPFLILSDNWIDRVNIIACGCAILLFILYQKFAGTITYNTSNVYSANAWNWQMFKIAKSNIMGFISGWGMYISLPIMIGGIICWIKNRKWLKYGYVMLVVIIIGLALNGGLSGYKAFPLLYAIMFMSIPLWIKILKVKS